MPRLQRPALLAGLTLGLLHVASGGAAWAAAAPRIFLSWNAPYGSPRAVQDLRAACDSTRRDTLYVCFDPGRDSTELVAIDAELRLWPADGDTLDRHWWFESRSNPAHLKADFNVADVPGATAPWSESGAGGIRTTSSADSARIRLVWAVRSRDFAVVRGGHRYSYARIVVPRPPPGPACARPVCIELTYARLTYEVGRRDLVRRGVRWATWNREAGDPCGGRARANPVSPWYPDRGRR